MFRVGCCGFPVSRKKYFASFSVVEVQMTFYRIPSIDLVKKWRDEAPEEFEFTLKAFQFFTHPSSSPTYRRLGRVLTEEEKKSIGFFRLNSTTEKAWDDFVRVANALLSDKIVFQTPSSFKPSQDNIERMKSFFEYIRPSGFTFFFEPRGKEWKGISGKVCRELGIFHVVDPTTGERPETEGMYYFRIHGGPGYRHRYTEDELRELYSYVSGLSGDVYVMFNNVSMFEDALRFKKLAGS